MAAGGKSHPCSTEPHNCTPAALFEEIAMSIGLAFWILMLVWLVFGLWASWPNHMLVGGNLLMFVLLLLLGWHAFGAPIK